METVIKVLNYIFQFCIAITNTLQKNVTNYVLPIQVTIVTYRMNMADGSLGFQHAQPLNLVSLNAMRERKGEINKQKQIPEHS